MWNEMDLNESEMDLNESEMDLNESEMDLNECEHFLKANWDRSKRVWTLSQSEPGSVWDPSKLDVYILLWMVI